MESGTSYLAAITGFIITGVGLPILAVTAISFVKNDARELADRVHPTFGLIFTSVVYLVIGPFFAIPRAATVGYEMSLEPFLDGSSALMLLVYTVIFFIFVYYVSLNPSKMVDQIGKYLTPILLIAIVALSIGGFLLLTAPLEGPMERYLDAPFFTGFVEGYLTMDAIAALAFGIVVVSAFKERGVTTRDEMVKSTLKAGTVTGIALIAVYASIGWIGARMATQGTFTNGGEILSAAANQMFGVYGALLLGVIVTLACFTTVVGLVVAVAQFFAKVTPISYKMLVLLVTIVSFAISNQGLEAIIGLSVPVLVFIYPIAIILILLTFLHRFFGGVQAVYRFSILITAIISLYDGLVEFGFELTAVTPVMESLPLFDIGLAWLIPAIIAGLIGWLIGRNKGDAAHG
jgi:LIVCS family branched-chain amino acid:cation transporter